MSLPVTLFSTINGVDLICTDCRTVVGDDEYYTEINPPGGYGRNQVLLCDNCMRSGRWDHWIKEHWPNWPEPRKC